MRKVLTLTTAFLFSTILFAQEKSDKKIENLINEIIQKIENFYSAEQDHRSPEIEARQKEIRKQLEKVQKQLEILKRNRYELIQEKYLEELKRIQKSVEAIRQSANELRAKIQSMKFNSLAPAFTFKGNTEIGKNDTIEGDILVKNGNLTIYGTIKGDIAVESGDVIVKSGAFVSGNIYTTSGKIEIEEGAIFQGEKFENFAIEEIKKQISYKPELHKFEARKEKISQEIAGFDNFYFEFERVSGFKIGLIYPRKVSRIISRLVSPYGYGGYATKSHRWFFSLGIDRIVKRFTNSAIIIGTEIHSTTDTKDHWIISPNANTISALIWNNDYRDYFRKEGFEIYLEFISMSSNLRISYLNDNYSNEETKFIKYASWNKSRPFRENPKVYEGNLKSLSINFRTNNIHLIESFKRSGVAFELTSEKELQSFKYMLVSATIFARVSLSDFDNLGIRFKMASADKILPKQKSFEIGGFGTLYAFPYKCFEGNKLLLLNAEYIFENPLDIFDLVNLFIFFDAGYVNNFAGNLTDGFNIKRWGDIKSDWGIGLGSESMRTRIYFAWRTDIKSKPVIVVRLSRPF